MRHLLILNIKCKCNFQDVFYKFNTGIDMNDNFKNKAMQLFKYAEKIGFPTVVAMKNERGNVATYCNQEFLEVSYDNDTEIEQSENIYLMVKSKGDLNNFLLKKAQIDKTVSGKKLIYITNPQILSTRH